MSKCFITSFIITQPLPAADASIVVAKSCDVYRQVWKIKQFSFSIQTNTINDPAEAFMYFGLSPLIYRNLLSQVLDVLNKVSSKLLLVSLFHRRVLTKLIFVDECFEKFQQQY